MLEGVGAGLSLLGEVGLHCLVTELCAEIFEYFLVDVEEGVEVNGDDICGEDRAEGALVLEPASREIHSAFAAGADIPVEVFRGPVRVGLVQF